jgi:nitroreductase
VIHPLTTRESDIVNDDRTAGTEHPIDDLLARRWSPRAFEPRAVSGADLRALLEAARWAPSCFNDQPWFFLAATRDEANDFDRLLGGLNAFNRTWARNAGALVLTVARSTFAHNGKPNAYAWHDIGLAAAQLTVEATARGLHVHQMAGILPDHIRETCGIPDGHDPVTGIAIGYLADPSSLPDDLADKETTQRSRKPQSEFVYSATWGEPASF